MYQLRVYKRLSKRLLFSCYCVSEEDALKQLQQFRIDAAADGISLSHTHSIIIKF